MPPDSIQSTLNGRRPLMSAPTLSFGTAQARRSAIGYLRLRLKPADRSCGFVQGAWWPRTDQLFTELPPLLAALAPRVGSVDRVIYDETRWAPQSLRMEFQGPQHHSRGLRHHLDQHTVGDRQGVRQAGSAGRSPLHQPNPRVHGRDDGVETRRCVDPRRIAGDRAAGGAGSPTRIDGAPALGVRRRSITPSGP